MAHAERRRGELKNARTLYRKFLLMEPQSKLRAEVESVLEEIDAALAEAPEAGPDAAARGGGGHASGGDAADAAAARQPAGQPHRAGDRPAAVRLDLAARG